MSYRNESRHDFDEDEGRMSRSEASRRDGSASRRSRRHEDEDYNDRSSRSSHDRLYQDEDDDYPDYGQRREYEDEENSGKMSRSEAGRQGWLASGRRRRHEDEDDNYGSRYGNRNRRYEDEDNNYGGSRSSRSPQDEDHYHGYRQVGRYEDDEGRMGRKEAGRRGAMARHDRSPEEESKIARKAARTRKEEYSDAFVEMGRKGGGARRRNRSE